MGTLGLIIGSQLNFDAKAITSELAKTADKLPAVAPTPAAAPATDADGPDIVVTGSNDTRVRIRAGRTSTSIASVLGPNDPTKNLLSIMYETGGLLFPYTPNMTFSQSVNWDPLAMVQTNWDLNTYQRTPSVNVSLNGIFTAQNQREGEYLMAVLHFLRVVTKSYYGTGEGAGDTGDAAGDKAAISSAQSKAGIPPPVLYLDGYGTLLFRSMPVVIKAFNYTFDENTDSKLFKSRSGLSARLPAKLMLSIELGAQMNPNRARSEFDLDKFRTGELLKSGGWF